MFVNIKLNALLEEKRISARELSRMTGIRHPSISDMCNNTTKMIPKSSLAKICEALDCDIPDILELKKEPS
ncbi:helix-turn-helix transcriptional regulator [Halobacillus sp. BBL2006]|uniref:helix-turn-helix domain-containing protein n=1 Tax=Halobacillus sp. BBL2006 TaxID=1543706 RepID=UPI0005443541|nr:helix-turn-helix transcriptional regulator [Halobacillus sp. BBL2006]KHE73146.1 XRE family transcriptional regulator [Halobacillus sp. BBL2006]